MLSRITTSIQLLLVFLHLVNAAHTNTFVPNTYVIEFDRSIHSFASKRHVYSKRSLFYEQLNANNINYDIRYEYEVINAVSMAFKTTEDATLFFEKAKGVKKAWPVV
jgi:minor extracellular serine protease Vpr